MGGEAKILPKSLLGAATTTHDQIGKEMWEENLKQRLW